MQGRESRALIWVSYEVWDTCLIWQSSLSIGARLEVSGGLETCPVLVVCGHFHRFLPSAAKRRFDNLMLFWTK